MMAGQMYPSRMELWETERNMKWAWQYLMSANLHDHCPINNLAMAIQAMRTLRESLYPEPLER